MADQLTDETTQPTLFDVEVPKHVNMQFLYAALQAAQTKVEAQDEVINSLQKQVKRLFATKSAPAQQPDVITKADLVGTPERKEFFCTVCSQGSGIRTTHDRKTANQHLDIKREAERNHGKPPKVQQAS